MFACISIKNCKPVVSITTFTVKISLTCLNNL